MNHDNAAAHRNRQIFSALVATMAFACLLAMPELAFAQETAESRVQNFFNNLGGLLNVASIAIVTIAIIFAGYQIAFNHKRIGDVAPVLLGGFLIGAAAQIARMLLPDQDNVVEGVMLMSETLLQHA
ncbi:TrbC/VirB2 family protein [Luteimonas sp. Y-2-2-4F]|nr:TrbC/VirB2 family protein [Luteimonas sp. Y-2-2-4F]MCD9031553.1 TrbC/VirB2 family protein [Luteimonas sp. Y-2-2-4F]